LYFDTTADTQLRFGNSFIAFFHEIENLTIQIAKYAASQLLVSSLAT